MRKELLELTTTFFQLFDCGGQEISTRDKTWKTIDGALTVGVLVLVAKSALDDLRDAWVGKYTGPLR